ITPVVGISSIMFHGYNDDLGTLDDVINGVGKISYSANSNSGFDFSELGRCVPNSFDGRFDRIEESFLLPSHKSELHYDTLLGLPNRIGISLSGYLSSKLAHLLLNLIAIYQ